MDKIGFDNEKYKKLQTDEIYNRIVKYDKLYIEVGGKLFDDNHASRVLPGFKPDVKIQIFEDLKHDLEVILCINARDIITGKERADNQLSYAKETLRLANLMKEREISVCGIMINLYEKNPLVLEFEEDCKKLNIKTYHSYFIENYPNDIEKIVSEDGFGKNDYIETNKKIILVSAPGANSGKLETCLSQLYNDKVHGVTSAYAKYETFPVWNLPVDSLVNIAYEMATSDLCDRNIVDPFYEKAYNKIAINYNRDVEAFPVLSNILTSICGYEVYKSPTDMGINNVGFAITDRICVENAGFKEIERRLNKAKSDYENHMISKRTLDRSEDLYNKAKLIYENLNK